MPVGVDPAAALATRKAAEGVVAVAGPADLALKGSRPEGVVATPFAPPVAPPNAEDTVHGADKANGGVPPFEADTRRAVGPGALAVPR